MKKIYLTLICIFVSSCALNKKVPVDDTIVKQEPQEIHLHVSVNIDDAEPNDTAHKVIIEKEYETKYIKCESILLKEVMSMVPFEINTDVETIDEWTTQLENIVLSVEEKLLGLKEEENCR